MKSTLTNLLHRRDLIRALVGSDIESSAAGKRLGWLWWLLDPLLMIGVYWFCVVLIFQRTQYEPYALFIGCALLAWKHLSSSLSDSVRVLLSQRGVVKSVAFPTAVLPIAKSLVHLTYCLFGVAVLIGVSAALGRAKGPELLQLVPLLALQTLLVMGLSLGLCCLGAMFRDLELITAHGLRAVWFLSPGMYGLDLVRTQLPKLGMGLSPDEWVTLYMTNPAAILFTGYRAAIHEPRWLEPQLWAILTVESVLSLVLGYAIYRRLEPKVLKSL